MEVDEEELVDELLREGVDGPVEGVEVFVVTGAGRDGEGAEVGVGVGVGVVCCGGTAGELLGLLPLLLQGF